MTAPEERSSTQGRRWALPVALALAAITVRLALVFLAAASLPPPTGDVLDRYYPVAASLASGQGFSDGGRPTAESPPLYPLLLAAIGATGPDDLTATRVLLSLGDGVLVALVVLLGRSLADERSAALAGLVTAVSPYFLYATMVGGNDGLFALLTTAFLLALVAAVERPGAAGFAVAGVALGLATLCRATSLFLPLVAVPAALLAIPRPRRRALRHGGAFLAAFLLVLTPWTIRNAIRFHALIPIQTLGGLHLLWATGDGPGDPQRFDAAPPATDARLYSRAVSNIVEHPARFLSRALQRSGRVWYATHSGLHQRILQRANLAMLALALGGVLLLRRRWRLLLPGLFTVLYFVALHSVTIALFRYMLAVVPLLTILAVVPVVRLRDRLAAWLGAPHD